MKEFKIKTMEIFVIIMTHVLMFCLGWKISYDTNFKHSENTESVSSASAQSGDLHGVREWNASDKTDESNDVIVDGTLENRITIEKGFWCWNIHEGMNGEIPCKKLCGAKMCKRKTLKIV